MTDTSKPRPSHETKAIEAKIKLNTSRRATLFQRVQQAYALIPNIGDPKVEKMFMTRCRDLEETRNEFSLIEESINELQLELDPNKEINHQALTSFDDLYYNCLATLDEINSKVHPPPGMANSCQTNNNSDSVRLPRIELQTFDGTLDKFIPWYNLFSSVINKSDKPPVQKLLYLQSCLIGEPHNLIKHLPATDVNYQVAIDILLDRYNSKRKLVSNYVEKLLTMEPLKTNSYVKLRAFYENLTEQYRALEALKIPDLSDFILFHLTFRNMDSETRKIFESQFKKSESSSDTSSSADTLPTFKKLLTFLGDQCKILEASNPSDLSTISSRSSASSLCTSSNRGSWERKGSFKQNFTRKPAVNHKNSYVAATSSSKNSSKHNNAPICPCCYAPHSIYICQQFRSLSVPQRKNKISSLGRCIRCLGNHTSSVCQSKSSCIQCKQNSHHTLLHVDEPSCASSQPNFYNAPSSSSSANMFGSVAHSATVPTSVLLGTAVVHVQDISGSFIEARILLDSGSQCSFFTKKFFSKLQLPYQRSDITITGLGETDVTQRKAIASVVIKPRLSSTPLLTTQVIIMDNLSGLLPATSLPNSLKDNFSHLPLADPYFFEAAPIDGIIGAELFPLISKGNPQFCGGGLPSALPSLFGWIIMGPVSSPVRISAFISEVQLDRTLKRFWEIEQPPSAKIVDPETTICEQIFKSHYRNNDGRYVVPLLLKDTYQDLGGNFGYAMRCLLSTEKRLAKNSILKEEYHSFMRDYESSGHMVKVNLSSLTSSYLIPHHAIFNPSSPTTKTRIVFNGSAPSNTGLSLNQVLHTGPKLQQDIVTIILNFRFLAIAFTADISKMYRQIKVLPDQTKNQRILWRYSPDDEVSAYELLVVTWGLRSSSYLACRSLLQLASDEAHSLPRVAQVIKQETYIDDIISGETDVNKALQLQADLISVFSSAGFELRKWSSNHPALLSSLPSDHVLTPLVLDAEEDDKQIKILGLQWNPSADDFTYRVATLMPRNTKREILSDISKLYDPMGWVSPVLLLAKHLIQQLWTLGVDWDDPIPEQIQTWWCKFVSQFHLLSIIKIPRLCLGSDNSIYRLVGFCDASEKAYAAVLYLHIFQPSGNSYTRILLAKSRVSPLKTLTIPRLELCGALLLARLFNSVLPILTPRLQLLENFAFSDSVVVLSWLRISPHLLKTFVSHRVAEITSIISPDRWHHVSSHDNPADCASRGLMPAEIVNNSLWFSGPSWLNLDVADWPLNPLKEDLSVVPEMKAQVFMGRQEKEPEHELLTRYSSLCGLIRVTAWLLRIRAVWNNSYDHPLTERILTSAELENSRQVLIRIVQKEHFSEDIRLIREGKYPTSRLRRLTPFIDSAGLLRVGGRLEHARLPESTRHPILLPKNSSFTDLLIKQTHVDNLHVGPRTLQSILERQYWILSARQKIRSRLSKCVSCLKMRSNYIQPLMGNIPLARLNERVWPFSTVGTDYGGPFIIKESTRRNARTLKAYLCIFVCFSTKAVHLEVVSDLSTDAFLAALERFISRRGIVSTIYSDQGTNFIGANRYLTDLHELLSKEKNRGKVQTYLANKRISWKFAAVAAPHFGGIYESAIKSAKHLLKRTIGSCTLTFEELSTVFTKVEAVLNSRPLTPISNDPAELEPLTPGHFLIGRPLTAIPDVDLTEISQNRLSRWQLLRSITQSFWKRWRSEYLSTLMQRQKWTKFNTNLAVGDLVLLNDGIKTPPLCWHLGRVTAVHPGADGIVRVVTLRTANGESRRPVVKLFPLPTSD